MNTCWWEDAVTFHGYYRTTADIDFWVAVNADNAAKLTRMIREFGFDVPELSERLFLQKGRTIRMGNEPTRIEILTEISRCEFKDCYERRVAANLDGIPVTIISRADLLKNKLSTGRLQDLNDAQKLG